MCFHLQLSGKGVSHQHGEYPAALDTSGGNQCLWRADISIQRSCIFVFQDFRDDLQHKVHSSAQRRNDHKGIFHSHFLEPQHNPASLLQASPIPLLTPPLPLPNIPSLRQSSITLIQQHYLIPAHFWDEVSMLHGYCPILFLSITSSSSSPHTAWDWQPVSKSIIIMELQWLVLVMWLSK